jgi:deoxycytidine triphosphate deaminase
MPEGKEHSMGETLTGIPTKKEIIEYLGVEKPIEERLFISPLLDGDQIGDTSIDLRLGQRFSVPKSSRMGLLDIVELHNEGESALIENYNESRVPFGQYFTLHPKNSVEVGTLEYLGIPRELEGTITLRASFSSIPILANTAQVHPGHRGIISLSLTSNANFSVKLYPGMRIAELQLRHVSTPIDKYRPSRYHYMTRPLPTELDKDYDLEFLGPIMEPLIIGIVSTIAAGRTTAITHLTERYGFGWFSLGDVLKSEAIKQGVPTLRPNLQDLGNRMREVHSDSYLAVKLKTSKKWQMNQNNLVIVDSFKNIAEVEEFRKQRHFTLIGIDAPQLIRWERVKSRRRQGDPIEYSEFDEQDKTDRGLYGSLSHAQQTEELIKNGKYIIMNDGTFNEFTSKLDEVVSRILYSA